jgi:hypothetical protein
MATGTQRVLDQHIAVFGESGSGKTVLVSSFYGPALEGKNSNGLWNLVADDTRQGNRLYQNYVGMRDHAKTPSPTRFAATTYYFSVRLRAEGTEGTRRPIDALRVGWHDYPGEWFEESPSSDEEAARRIDGFRALLQSDVAILLVDGQKLLEYADQEERYLKSLLGNYRQGLLRLREPMLADGVRLTEFPRIWILALSKSDLFPDWTVDTFRDLVIGAAAEHIEGLGDVLRDFVDTPEALSIGEDFLLLSSAKFASAPSEGPTIDVHERIGLDLILPLVSMFPLERRAEWETRMEIPRRVLDKFADGFDAIGGALALAQRVGMMKVAARFPKFGPFLVLAEGWADDAIKLGGEKLKEFNENAKERKDVLAQTMTQFKLDLEIGVARKQLIRSPK